MITPNYKTNTKIKGRKWYIKKSAWAIRKKVRETEIYDFIHDQKNNYSVQTMCDVLDVPRSTYYDSQDKTIFKREQENIELTEEIIKFHCTLISNHKWNYTNNYKKRTEFNPYVLSMNTLIRL